MGQGIPSDYIMMSPEYQIGYEQGFKDMQRAVIKRIKFLEKELSELEAFVTATATATVSTSTEQ